ncbi:hypothetical protein [Schaalia vaccimaxillae]|uniref:hypothetical protein n=1 Tax=Schaalia vaccimaxillae TaxID=183916 RepID=UPI00047DCAFF|nr:hypothetical protein [Schaalia vaccimaxillae]
MKRPMLILSVIVVAILLNACALSPAKTRAAEGFTTQGQALAIQLSKSAIRYVGTPSETGYMILSDSSGQTRAFKSGQMFAAQPLWTEYGLFYGGANSEFLTTDEGTQQIPRDIEPDGELARYERNNGRGFMSFYNMGSDREGYQQPVLIGSADGTESIDVRGAYMNMGACGDSLYAVGQTKFAPNLLDQAKSIYQEHKGDTTVTPAQDENFDILVQVHPANHPQNPTVIESFPHDERYSRGTREFICHNNSIYLLSFLLDNPNAQRGDGTDPRAGHAALEIWDLQNHERRSLDIVDRDGSFVDLLTDDVTIPTGSFKGTEYRFVTMTGKVFSVDVTTGIGNHLYTFEESPDGGAVPRFDVTDQAIYRLDNGKNINSPLNFSRYVFDTGQYEHLFDVESLGSYRRGEINIEGIAVNPSWEKTTF